MPARRAVKTQIFSVALVLASISTLQAQELPEIFTPVRPAGMGGAHTAIANDDNAIWTNPAGIARVRKARSRATVHRSKFPNLAVGTNTAAQKFYQEFKGQETTVEDLVRNGEDVTAGKPFWLMTSMFPFIMFDAGSYPMAFGIYSRSVGKVVIEKASAEAAQIDAVSDIGGVITAAWTNRTNRLNLGVTIRPMARYAYQGTVPTATLQNQSELKSTLQDDANQSSAIAVDLGAMFTLADFWFPTVGLAVFNVPTGCHENYLNPFSKTRQKICGTKFSGNISNQEALSVVDPTDVRIGFSITPRLSQKVGMRIGVDAHHLWIPAGTTYYGLPEVDAIKLLHAGAELFFGNPLQPSPFSLRTGYSQGFYSMGASMEMPFFSLDIATYGRDVSTTADSLEDRRIVGSFSFDF